MRILSIQSSVAHGHVGNSAAVFPLQRIGHEVLPVFTVQFSNHTGYGAWRGPVLAAEDVHQVILGIEDRGVLAEVDLVLSGYLGSAAIAEVVLDAVERTKAANPAAWYACDPAIGNAHAGRFVDPAIPPLFADRLVPRADLITPNAYELGHLTGGFDGSASVPGPEPILAAAHAVRARGPETILVTSIEYTGTPELISMLAVTGGGAWQVTTPRLPGKVGGSGDVTAALFSAHLRATGDAPLALARTASSVFDLLEATLNAGSAELLLVEAQHAYADPQMQFEAEALGAAS